MGKLRRTAFVRAYLKRDDPTWYLMEYMSTYTGRKKRFRLPRRKSYDHLSLSEFTRMIKHPVYWWSNQYWILNGGTDRKNQLHYRQMQPHPPRKSRIASKLAYLRRHGRS